VSRRAVGYAVAWVLAAVVAVTAGVLAVSSVGASVRDRGPLGNEVVRQEVATSSATPAPGATRTTRVFEDDFGTLEVECRGLVAHGLGVQTAPGWRTRSFESGPDEEVEAVFVGRGGVIEIEVYCNRGWPRIADLDRTARSDDDADDGDDD